MELKVLVHPYTAFIKPEKKLIRKYDNFIKTAEKIIVFYSPVTKQGEKVFYNLTSIPRKELKKEKNVVVLPTYSHEGALPPESKIELTNILKELEVEQIIFAGQTVDFTSTGSCVDGIIKEMNKILKEDVPFSLQSELLSTMEDYCPKLYGTLNIKKEYNTEREIILT